MAIRNAAKVILMRDNKVLLNKCKGHDGKRSKYNLLMVILQQQ